MWMVPRNPLHYLIKIKHLFYLDIFFSFEKTRTFPRCSYRGLGKQRRHWCAPSRGTRQQQRGKELFWHLPKSLSSGLSLFLRLPLLLCQLGRSRELRFFNKILIVSPMKSQIGLINKLNRSLMQAPPCPRAGHTAGSR